MAKFLIAASVLLLVFAVRAEDLDPPAYVGRLSVIDGESSIYPPGETSWSAAPINYPVTAGLWIWNPANSRSEVQIGSTLLRLGQVSELGALVIDPGQVRLHLATGELSVRLGEVPAGGFRIETPGGVANLLEPGWYHLEAGSSQDGMPARSGALAVLAGRAEFTGPFPTVELGPGQRADSDGSGEPPEIAQAVPTQIDAWEPRDERGSAMAQTLRYVSPGMTGYQDLETYGRWEDTADYGPIWYPNAVAADWAPYRYGRWRYVAPWGWTWIDDAPWGFTPFHYGRWLRIGLRWAWTPGAFDAQPVYAPALVAFYDMHETDGPGIGWVPLGPSEPFRPYYHATDRYRERLNRGEWREHRHDDDDRGGAPVMAFANSHAATAVPRSMFSRGLPVQGVRRPWEPDRVRDAGRPADVDALRPSGEFRRPPGERPGTAPVVVPGPLPGAAPRVSSEGEDRNRWRGDREAGERAFTRPGRPFADGAGQPIPRDSPYTPPTPAATPPAPRATLPAPLATPRAPQATPPTPQATPLAPAGIPDAFRAQRRESRPDAPLQQQRETQAPRAAPPPAAREERPRVFRHPNQAMPEPPRNPMPRPSQPPARAAPPAAAPPAARSMPAPAERRGEQHHQDRHDRRDDQSQHQ